MHHPRVGHNSHVGPLALDVCHAERNEKVLFGYKALHAIEHLVFNEHDRIVITDCCLEQALGIERCAGHHDVDAGEMGPQRLQALRVVRCDAAPGSTLGPDDHGHDHLSAEHIPVLGALIGDLIHGQGGKIHVHYLCDGAHAGHRRTYCGTANGGL